MLRTLTLISYMGMRSRRTAFCWWILKQAKVKVTVAQSCPTLCNPKQARYPVKTPTRPSLLHGSEHVDASCFLCIFNFKYINFCGFIWSLFKSTTVKTTKVYVKNCAVDENKIVTWTCSTVSKLDDCENDNAFLNAWAHLAYVICILAFFSLFFFLKSQDGKKNKCTLSSRIF